MPTHTATTVTFAGSGVLVALARALARSSEDVHRARLAFRAANHLELAGELTDSMRRVLREIEPGTDRMVERSLRADLELRGVWQEGVRDWVKAFPEEARGPIDNLGHLIAEANSALGRAKAEVGVRRVVGDLLGAAAFKRRMEDSFGRLARLREGVEADFEQLRRLDELAQGPMETLLNQVGVLRRRATKLTDEVGELIPPTEIATEIDRILLAQKRAQLPRPAEPEALRRMRQRALQGHGAGPEGR